MPDKLGKPQGFLETADINFYLSKLEHIIGAEPDTIFFSLSPFFLRGGTVGVKKSDSETLTSWAKLTPKRPPSIATRHHRRRKRGGKKEKEKKKESTNETNETKIEV